MRKICSKCKLKKPAESFNQKKESTDGLSWYCKSCQADASRRHYEANKDRVKDRARRHSKKQKESMRRFVWEYKSKHPCVDCGEPDPIVLEFDHIDPDTKDHDVSYMVMSYFSKERIVKEIDKCAVRCANCHRRKTRKEDGGCSDLL